MPNIYIENAEKWRNIADIDYITQFVKAWIAFNAWYKNFFTDLETDREAINSIKAGNNRFKDRLESLLSGNDNESTLMRNYISNLHYQLERHHIQLERDHIVNNDQYISFEKIVIETNPQNHKTITRNTLIYEVTRDSNNHKLIKLKITSRNGKVKLEIQQNNGYNLDECKNDAQYQNLSHNQKSTLEYCYKEINPKKPTCLIAPHESEESIQMGNYKFINDTDKLCKGTIEILYLLRNSLFHGQIIPNKETNRVYESAYHILHKLIEEL